MKWKNVLENRKKDLIRPYYKKPKKEDLDRIYNLLKNA